MEQQLEVIENLLYLQLAPPCAFSYAYSSSPSTSVQPRPSVLLRRRT